jgi:hypothetical protein
VEATIWQVGSGEGIKKVLAEISLGKEVTVSGGVKHLCVPDHIVVESCRDLCTF